MSCRKRAKIERKVYKTTEKVTSSLFKLNSCLPLSYGICILGPPSSGKSALFDIWSQEHGKDLLTVHIDSSVDSKNLIGTYVCGETPGEFVWKTGILTYAVTAGKWLLFENLDRMGDDVLSLLSNLIRTNRLEIPNKNDRSQDISEKKELGRSSLIPNEGFKILATCTKPLEENSCFITINIVEFTVKELWEIRPGSLVTEEFAEVFSEIHTQMALLPGRALVTADWEKLIRRASWQIERIYGKKGIVNGLLTENCKENILIECLCVYGGIRDFQAALEKLTSILCLDLKSSEAFVHNRAIRVIKKEHIMEIGISPSLVVKNSIQEGLSLNAYSLKIIEKIASCIAFNESPLLVGETGCGKTSFVQFLAKFMDVKLYVHNLSQASDPSDIVGGFKPIAVSTLLMPIITYFFKALPKISDTSVNAAVKSGIQQAFKKKNWEKCVGLLDVAVCELEKIYPSDKKVRKLWDKVQDVKRKLKNSQFAFQFVEGSLVKAMKEGSWVLLEEINLAEEEVLERLHSVLEGKGIHLIEKGEIHSVQASSGFRLFGCMNPGKQVGKKELPQSLRSKFTEILVPEMEKFEDVLEVVRFYLEGKADRRTMENIVNFYLEVRKLSKEGLIEDGCGRCPQYSMRTLCRSLRYALEFSHHYSFSVSLYNGIKVFFETPLKGSLDSLLQKLSPAPTHPQPSIEKSHINIQGSFHERGPKSLYEDPHFILTPSVKKNLSVLSRAVIYKNNSVLLEGPTSSGKTSMVKYLAGLLGHEFVRINNHEHTDIEEYIGSYVSDSHGRLVFCEGPLVRAVRDGHFLVLDELNLAPSEVLEALNRLLDDNHELFITETQETVKPHKDFRLFATQNPTSYAGRKELSKAFRNRFVEMFVPDLPDDELIKILEIKGRLAPSYALVLINIMRDLQRQRQQTRAFLGRHGFITIRDLLKIAKREPMGYEELAHFAYIVLAERLRSDEEKKLVQEVIEKHCKKAKIDIISFYDKYFDNNYKNQVETIIWNSHMKRLFCLVNSAISKNEPVLLVGETGCGKTSICQALAEHYIKPLRILNCHQHTETSDFIGSLRPVRNKSLLISSLLTDLNPYIQNISSYSLEDIFLKLQSLEIPLDTLALLTQKLKKAMTLFEWVDGPLVQAFIQGEYFLVDEISLADDSVLERLNSVLESERKLLIPEKAVEVIEDTEESGSEKSVGKMQVSGSEEMEAHEGFQIFATMNPGGDYGKKELSPALRNRFTEIWVSISIEDMREIVSKKTENHKELMTFIENYNKTARVGLSLRDALTCADFMNKHISPNGLWEGLALVLPTESLPNLPQTYSVTSSQGQFGISPYYIPCSNTISIPYSFQGPQVLKNLYSLLRAMMLSKAILLEGPPGVGKTSIIEALGKVLQISVVRVNLSEETDLIDLLGCDLPSGDKFEWCDGVLLNAVKTGKWLILDELNLCPQQVIEGLNALLDHRATVFIPEINQEVKCAPGFRLFAAQNPVSQGGGRKGLPKSFLNRFTKIYMHDLGQEDYLAILSNLFGAENNDQIIKMSQGLRKNLDGPWEFNLRDMLRWKEGGKIEVLYYSRLRTQSQKDIFAQTYNQSFNQEFIKPNPPFFRILPQALVLDEKTFHISEIDEELVPKQLKVLKDFCDIINNSWPVLLVGSKGCGKRTVIKIASKIFGAELIQYSLSANSDSGTLLGSFEQSENGKFEWFESNLIRAVKTGQWVLLKNCNKCPAAVLDRINSLLEPGGQLLINERGLVNGQSYVVYPHQNFRIIFSYNPMIGEVSRALRNRCVELFMDAEYSYMDFCRIYPLSYDEYENVKENSITELAKWKYLAEVCDRKKAYEIVYNRGYDFMECENERVFEPLRSMLIDPLTGYFNEDSWFLMRNKGVDEAKECFMSNGCVVDMEDRLKYIGIGWNVEVFKDLKVENVYYPLLNLLNDLRFYIEMSLIVSKVYVKLQKIEDLAGYWYLVKCQKPYSKYKFSKGLPQDLQKPSPIDKGLLCSWKHRLSSHVLYPYERIEKAQKLLTVFEFNCIINGKDIGIGAGRKVIKVIDEDFNEKEIGILATKENYQSEERIYLEEVADCYEQVLFKYLITCMDNNKDSELSLNFYPKSYLMALWILKQPKSSLREVTLPILRAPTSGYVDFLQIYETMKDCTIIDAPKYWSIATNMLKWPKVQETSYLPTIYLDDLSQELEKTCETDQFITKFLTTSRILGLGIWLYKLYIKINIDPCTIYSDLQEDYIKIMQTIEKNIKIRMDYHDFRMGFCWENELIKYYKKVLHTTKEKAQKNAVKVRKPEPDSGKFIEYVRNLPSYSR